jgi:hypothetical protein
MNCCAWAAGAEKAATDKATAMMNFDAIGLFSRLLGRK